MQSKSERLAQDLRPPEQLTLDEIRERLVAQDKHPDLYLRARRRQEAIKRDEADREAARESWLRSGGDPQSFDREWEKISTEAKRLGMEQEQREARESSERYARESF